MCLAAALMAIHTYAYQEVVKICDRLVELGADRLDIPEFFEAKRNMWAVCIMQARPGMGIDAAEELLQYAKRSGNAAHLSRGLSLTQLGQYERSAEALLQCLEYEDVEDQPYSLFPLRPGIGARAQLALDYWYLGRPDTAVATGIEGVRHAIRLRSAYGQAFAEMYLAGVHQLRREPHEVLRLTGSALLIASERGQNELYRWSAMRHGWAVAELGNVHQGLAEMQEALAISKASGSVAARPHFLCLMAGVLLRAGRFDEGIEAVEEAFGVIHGSGSRAYEAEAYRLKGELFLRRTSGDPLVIERLFRQAIETAREQHCRGFELRALTSLVRLQDLIGTSRDGRHELRAALSLFDEGLETADVSEARSLLGAE
jgi:adenylate cyclase